MKKVVYELKEFRPKEKQYLFIDNTLCESYKEAVKLKKELVKEGYKLENLIIQKWYL